jgi:hypothetical protein
MPEMVNSVEVDRVRNFEGGGDMIYITGAKVYINFSF